jgi:O-methyltransferase involved in polyketide biosynthesis
MEPHQKIMLEPTAAMAMLIGKGIYEGDKLISKYMERIDLSSGIQLAERLKQSSKFAEDLMKNRKFFYHDYIFKHIRSNQYNSQVIILGVGYDPIAIHLLGAEADKIESIIEIDMSNFDSKKTIFKDIEVPHLEKVKFVQANVVTGNTIDIIRQFGYDDHKPTVITLEGMMYYLSEQHFVDLIKSFKSPNNSNSFCVDYLFPWEEAPTEELRLEHKNGAEAVERQSKAKLTYYSKEKIVNLIKKLGGTSIEVCSQKDIELKRTGVSKCFTREKEGIFEFITFNI